MVLNLAPEGTIPGLYINPIPEAPSQSLINNLFNKYLLKPIIHQAHNSQRTYLLGFSVK